MTEYGIVADDGLIEGGFWSLAEAQEALAKRYADCDGLTVEALCHDHPDHPANGCPECDDEDEEEVAP